MFATSMTDMISTAAFAIGEGGGIVARTGDSTFTLMGIIGAILVVALVLVIVAFIRSRRS